MVSESLSEVDPCSGTHCECLPESLRCDADYRNTSAQLLAPSPMPTDIGPLQYDEIDIGEAQPVRCLKNALWVAVEKGVPYAVLLAPSIQHGRPLGISVEIGVSSGEAASEFSQSFFRQLVFFFKQKTAYEVGLGIPAEPLFRSSRLRWHSR